MKLYPSIWDLSKRIEGLVTNLGVHASGVLIINGDITKHNSAMKTSSEVVVTAWDLHDSEDAGALKYDFLTIAALDKIRTTMNYLIDDGLIQWQGTLKRTYDKYLLPKHLDYNNPDMWRMAYEGKIIELFQFDTLQGGKAIRMIRPTRLRELATGNSVMRLMAEGEQPIDIYVKNKNDLKKWYTDMMLYHLTEEEEYILEKYLKPVYGVAASQEIVMQLTMDSKIAGFNIKQANTLRKGIAKKDPKSIEAAKDLFYNKGQEIGTRMELLDYVWNKQISMSLGYSFSDLHTVAYSTIALQEMNLAYQYPIIYWNCACLSVNANAINEEDYKFEQELDEMWDLEDEEVEAEEDSKKKKASKVNYDKIAMAIGKFKSMIIKSPDINKAKLGFIPDAKDNSVMFGLKGISKIGDDLVNEIIARRPYDSLNNFVEKMVEDGKKLISKDRVINLIKAGCFDALEQASREEVMKRFIGSLVEPKKKLTISNVPMLINYDLFPVEMNYEKGVYLFTKEARKAKDGNGFYNLDDIMVAWYRKWIKQEPLYLNNQYKIRIVDWDNIYNKEMNSVRSWLKANETTLIEQLHHAMFKEEWDKYASGDKLKWELDSLNFYHSGHPLTSVETPLKHTPVNELKENDFNGYWNIKGNMVPKMNLHIIFGTVLTKNKQKSLIVLSTPEGVIQVKLYKQQFAKYDKVIKDVDGEVVEPSFFDKGTFLCVTGILRDEVFIPKVYKNTEQDSIIKVILDDDYNFIQYQEKS